MFHHLLTFAGVLAHARHRRLWNNHYLVDNLLYICWVTTYTNHPLHISQACGLPALTSSLLRCHVSLLKKTSTITWFPVLFYCGWHFSRMQIFVRYTVPTNFTNDVSNLCAQSATMRACTHFVADCARVIRQVSDKIGKSPKPCKTCNTTARFIRCVLVNKIATPHKLFVGRNVLQWGLWVHAKTYLQSTTFEMAVVRQQAYEITACLLLHLLLSIVRLNLTKDLGYLPGVCAQWCRKGYA